MKNNYSCITKFNELYFIRIFEIQRKSLAVDFWWVNGHGCEIAICKLNEKTPKGQPKDVGQLAMERAEASLSYFHWSNDGSTMPRIIKNKLIDWCDFIIYEKIINDH